VDCKATSILTSGEEKFLRWSARDYMRTKGEASPRSTIGPMLTDDQRHASASELVNLCKLLRRRNTLSLLHLLRHILLYGGGTMTFGRYSDMKYDPCLATGEDLG
jgi:hypothetical protein